jgi:chromosome segregation and condensation protein ScpB
VGPRHERQIWDEQKLKRLAAGRADGLTMAELAMRFNCSRVTVERKLAELRREASFDASELRRFAAQFRPGWRDRYKPQ